MAERLSAPALPEFTRSLRGFASPAALASRDHERLFAPLLTARKAAARVESAEGRLASFDPARLGRALSEAIAEVAAERVRVDGGERRALAARLNDMAVPAFAALALISEAAAAWRVEHDAARERAWDRWVTGVQKLFDATDRLWLDVHALLGAPEPLTRRGARKGHALSRVVVGVLVIAGAVVVFLLLLGMSPAALAAQHVTLRVVGVRPESLTARGFDVVGSDAGSPLVVVDPRERARMEGLGWSGVAIGGAGGARGAFQAVATPRVYRSYDNPARGVRAFIDSMAANNPRISVDTIGRSFEGRPMLAVKIGPKGDSPSRPNVLFMAAYHAREWAATENALRLIRYLANPPVGSARIDSLLQARDIWILPVANPDGYEYTFNADRLWRKTRSPQAGGAVGVDMNRNHRARWGLDNIGSSNQAASEVYRGPSPASEIETRNIEAFHAAHPPVVSVSYHTYAGLLLFPPGSVSGERPADLPVYQALGGTNLRSAVTDHLIGSARTFYSPSNGWMLYTTNGDYNDWASSQYGAISFTPELSSGYTSGSYYGFEFPDDETQLRQLFEDNLPFALDVIESASDPLHWASPTTGIRSDRVVLESVSPDVRVTVPASSASASTISTSTTIGFRIDSSAGGRYTRRLISTVNGRPTQLSIAADGQTVKFSVLVTNGAEPGESGWTASGFRADSLFQRAGKYSWLGSGGELRSPTIRVAANIDTVSLVFWTRYFGSGFDENPYALVRLSIDAGASFAPVLRVQGSAPEWYPERVTVGGVKGRDLVFAFNPAGMAWRLDEINVVAHAGATPTDGSRTVALRPSENPVRRGDVSFPWPFTTPDGAVQVFDMAGRLVWRKDVRQGETVQWNLAGDLVANGVYIVVARSGGRSVQLKLFVARTGR